MVAIKTQEDWWKLLNAHWADILECFQLSGAPMTLDERGYWWADGIGRQATRHDKPFVTVLEELKRDGDAQELGRYLNLCWIAAPDSPSIHYWPSWGALCDLCSEMWVFEPEEKQA